VQAPPVRAPVVVIQACALSLRVVGDLTSALRALEEPRERCLAADDAFARRPDTECRLKLVPLLLCEYTLVLSDVLDASPHEAPDVERILEDRFHAMGSGAADRLGMP